MSEYEQKLAESITRLKANYDKLYNSKRHVKFIDYKHVIAIATAAKDNTVVRKQCQGIKMSGKRCTKVGSSTCGRFCKKHFTNFRVDV